MSGEAWAQLITGSALIVVGVLALLLFDLTTRTMLSAISKASLLYERLGLDWGVRHRDMLAGFFRLWFPFSAILFGVLLVLLGTIR